MIEQILVRTAEIPMARPFVHAAKSRHHTASVLVTVTARGQRGWGEGAPRPYVTGETVASAEQALRRISPDWLNRLIDLNEFEAAVRQLASLDLSRLVGGGQPARAAATALEIALFDLICRLHGRSGLDGLRSTPLGARLLAPTGSPAPVSCVLDLAKDPAETISALGERAISSIRHVKLKATKLLDTCVRHVSAVRERFSADTTISVDANGDWDRATAVLAARRLAPLRVGWLEEPVRPRDWAALREVREAGGVPVMLDESCVDTADLEIAHALSAVDSVNARISKCGGLFPTLRLVQRARELGLGVQLGVQVGEVGPLWAAGRLLATALEGLATAEAGRQDDWFPVPLTEPPYAVDRERYLAGPVGGVGIGVLPGRDLNQHWEELT